jgi:hypothetical protein
MGLRATEYSRGADFSGWERFMLGKVEYRRNILSNRYFFRNRSSLPGGLGKWVQFDIGSYGFRPQSPALPRWV